MTTEALPDGETSTDSDDTRSASHTSDTPPPQTHERSPSCLLLTLLLLVSTLEGADQYVLPVTFHAMATDLGLTIKDLSVLATAQALSLAVAGPFWGIIADRGIVTRKSLLISACTGWGLATAAMAFITSWGPMIFLRALNGIMLSSQGPIISGIVPDVTCEACRGKIFGQLHMAMFVGRIFSSLVITPIASSTILGIKGWRIAFSLLGFLSLLLALALLFAMTEPKREHSTTTTEQSSPRNLVLLVWEEITRFFRYLSTGSFSFLVLQGVFGYIGFQATISYLTLFLQTAGISDSGAGAISTAYEFAGCIGACLGGIISDRLTSFSRYHGRPLTAQLSIAFAMIFFSLVFLVVSPSAQQFWTYLGLLVAAGLVSTWSPGGVVHPILSEIVQPECRCSVYAWQYAISGASGALLSNLGVAFFSSLFGFNLTAAKTKGHNHMNAIALGKAILYTALAPWFLCFVFYSLLHWSYPRDHCRICRLDEQEQSERQMVTESQDTKEEINVCLESPTSRILNLT